MIITQKIDKFPYGQIDTIEDRKIPKGAASKALDWIPQGDRIELRRGNHLIGSDDGAGKVTGLHVGYKANGAQVLFKTYARKLKFFDESLATPAWVENGSNILPAAANGEETSFDNYSSLAGAQVFLSSPNTGLFKIMVANPGSYTDLTDSTKNFAGYLKAYFNRIILWYRLKDKTGIYGSYIDSQNYTTVAAEVLASVATGTLAFKGGGATRTCFGVQITVTATGEIFVDDYNGVLTGSLGNTGTVNYTTGAFTTTATGAGTADYQWENSNNGGLGDFTKSATRLAGQGFIFRQDDGGGSALGVGIYSDILFCLHQKRTWQLALTRDDTGATNLPFRDRVGIPNVRAYVPTGSGIYYVDDQNSNDVQLRLLTLQQLSGLVVPVSVSKKAVRGIILGVDLTAYLFDKAAMIEWGDYVVLACRRANSDVNDRVLLYNTKSGAFSWHNYFVSCFAIYNGILVAGDSVSNNVYELFSGWDDDDSEITTNYWETELSDHDIEELKKTRRLVLQGLISVEQGYDIYVNPDNNGYTKLGTSISGSGTYVDKGQAISIGSNMLGTQQIGGSGTSLSAYNYEHAIRLGISKYERVKLKFVATGLGYVSIGSYKWWKIARHGKKVLNKYS